MSSTTFRCPHCGETFSREPLVRAHIALATDTGHRNRNGFMPEDVIEVVEGDDVVDERSGDGKQQVDLTTADLPDGLSEPEKHIIKTVVLNVNVDSYRELAKRANATLTANGLETFSEGHMTRKIKDLFVLPTESEERTVEDLTKKQRRVLEQYAANPDATMTSIAKSANVAVSYPSHVIDQYGHLAERIESSDTVSAVTDGGGSSEDWKERLTETQAAIIDFMARHPEATNQEIADAVGCAKSYPSRIRRQHADLLRQRAQVHGTVDAFTEETETEAEPERTYEDLTEKQQRVVDRLAEESDPENPDASFRELAADCDAHASYVVEIAKKYGELANERKEQLQSASAATSSQSADEQAAESVVDGPTTGTAGSLSVAPTWQDFADDTDETDDQADAEAEIDAAEADLESDEGTETEAEAEANAAETAVDEEATDHETTAHDADGDSSGDTGGNGGEQKSKGAADEPADQQASSSRSTSQAAVVDASAVAAAPEGSDQEESSRVQDGTTRPASNEQSGGSGETIQVTLSDLDATIEGTPEDIAAILRAL